MKDRKGPSAARAFQPSIPLYAGLTVNSAPELEEVLRLLDSLQDLEPSKLGRFRIVSRQTRYEPEKKKQPQQGRRIA